MGVGQVLTMPLFFASNCIPVWRRKEPSPIRYAPRRVLAKKWQARRNRSIYGYNDYVRSQRTREDFTGNAISKDTRVSQ
jgi:hypothetical protein